MKVLLINVVCGIRSTGRICTDLATALETQGQESEFAMELRERYGDELKKEQFECPLCGGRLVKRSGPYGEFFGCSNYRTTGCTYKRKIR